MTQRPVYFPSEVEGKFVNVKNIEFKWYSGFAVVQKQKSIASFHESIKNITGIENILEISSKSSYSCGIAASAFNLFVYIEDIKASVESIYQGSKVFEYGGPYTDLYNKTSLHAKKDSRLKESGRLKYFNLLGQKWSLDEDFYSWLYLNGLMQNNKIKDEIVKFDAFTDIEFNPKKSFNCQANSAAIFTSCIRKNINIKNFLSIQDFKSFFKKEYKNGIQTSIF